MAAVDFCPTVSSASTVPTKNEGIDSIEFNCTSCNESFATTGDLRVHCKTERHLYNMKRRLAGLRPISKELWDKKVQESRSMSTEQKGTAHLKKGKESRKSAGSTATSQPTPSSLSGNDVPESNSVLPDNDVLTPQHCLFDRRHFESIDECLAYMQKTYSFSIPEPEYCTDVPGLLSFLGRKIAEPPHACINCNRGFPDLASVRRHMIDKSHTRIGTEARTRRGNVSKDGTEELQAELEDFYDYRASTREVTERVRDPQQKVAALLRYFDTNRDGRLHRGEMKEFWAAMSDGAVFTDGRYTGACGLTGTDPDYGLDAVALGQLYAEGFADVDAHFEVLQELLTQRFKRAKNRKDTEGSNATDAQDEDKGDDDNTNDAENDESSEGSSDDSEDDIIECEDEDEFEEIMRVLGLQPVSIMPNGDLRLPNGSSACHRDVAYVYRQRGRRFDQLALPTNSTMGGRAGPRTQLMLSNASSGCAKIAMSRRCENREGKRIIAMLHRQQLSQMQLGMKQNILQTKRGNDIRTGRGDCSAGR